VSINQPTTVNKIGKAQDLESSKQKEARPCQCAKKGHRGLTVGDCSTKPRENVVKVMVLGGTVKRRV
jgi:hypothetical protein